MWPGWPGSASRPCRGCSTSACPARRTPLPSGVRKVAAELGYVRDPLASGLRRVGTSTIGVVVPHLTDTVMAMFYEEIAAAAIARGLFAVVASTNDDPDTERVAVESLVRRRVDGLILTTARIDTPIPLGPADRALPHVLALRTNDTSFA